MEQSEKYGVRIIESKNGNGFKTVSAFKNVFSFRNTDKQEAPLR